ncbi:hemolysin family protein [Spirochaeta thermophila]|uniref:HlyC/CorC family transporter n=1 Tax=Winmispira thermophila (strain ATCC 49972 / DSM 6192 / RI 19.B1) TaxID=665571 RepID=E0RNA2_WINT6|nr:hemolysin family protein [Spirochaeta thermophila]ADN01102.1 hypothetical protein STHERM_c01260 [Spirochaeta thermophila DSM 6192]
MIVPLLVLAFLLFLSAFFSGTETAFTSLSFVDIQTLKKKAPKKGHLIEKMLSQPDIFLTTVLIGNNLANLSASAFTTTLTIRLAGSTAVGLSTGVLTMVVLLFSEILPKRLAFHHNTFIALHTVRILWILSFAFRPVIWILSGITRILLPRNEQPPLTEEAILHTLSLAHSTGAIEPYKTRMMRRIIRFSEATLHTIMTHRTRIFSLPQALTVGEALPHVLARPFSRIPLYHQNPEDISGIVHLRDLLKAHAEGKADTPLFRLAVTPLFLPETMRIYNAFTALTKAQHKMAIVLDEYGGLAGLVTTEDIIEEIVGELYDENEQKEETPLRRLPHGWYKVAGKAPLYLLLETFELDLEEKPDASTVAGYLTEVRGTLPESGEVIETPLGTFKVTVRSRTSIDWVEYLPPGREEHGEGPLPR